MGITYEPLDMMGYPVTLEDGVASCQARCAQTPGCAHYSFWEPGGQCHVHSAAAKQHKHQSMFFSGPPTCDASSRDELELLSDTMKERICYKEKVAYTPLDSAAHGAVAAVLSTPSKCQERCAATSWCAHFTYSILDSMCHLADKDATQISDVLNSVAGPQSCQDQVTFALSVGGVSYQKLMSQVQLQAAFIQAVKKAVSEAAGARADLDGGEGDGLLVSTGDQEVVLARGPAGSLAVGVMVQSHAGEVPSGAVQRLLWKKLTHLEVKVAQYIAEADPDRTVFEGVIHVRILTPPSSLEGRGGAEDGGASAKDESWKLLRKFESLAGKLVGEGDRRSATSTHLVAVCFTSGLLVVALVAAAVAVKANQRRQTMRAAYAALTFSMLNEHAEPGAEVRGVVPELGFCDMDECA